MRPSIAAALSTLGPIHSAAAVLLTPEDVDRFADVEGPDEGHRRVIERPDGSLILMLEFEDDNFGLTYAFVGAVPKDAWTWADPKKDGDRLDSFTAAEIDALPEGAQFVGPTHDPADPGGPGYLPLTKGADGRWHGLRTPLTFAAVSMLSGRTLLLPVAKRTPKDGDRIDSFTAAELDGLPVGARFDDNNNGLSPLVKGPHGWSRAGAAGFCTSADVKALCCADRTLVLPKPTEAPKLAASPKVGDRLRDLTPEQRANLPIGTVVTRICLGREASAVLTLDRASGSSDVTGAVWLVTFNGETREVPAEDLADDNAIVILPTLPPPPPAPKVGDRWGNLTPDQRAALPMGTVLDGTGSLPPVVKVGSGWVCVEDGGKVGGFVPERTIAFLPVSK